MPRYILIFLVALFLAGHGCAQNEPAAITIGNIHISAQEFEAAYKTSPYIYQGADGKKAFLDSYVTKKLILAEAERMNLDKDPAFLNDIQMFWEQGLLKLVLLEKSKEFASQARATDEEIEAFYNEQRATFNNKPLAQVRDQILSVLEKEKQVAMMTEWVNALKARIKIAIDYTDLGIEDQQGGQK